MYQDFGGWTKRKNDGRLGNSGTLTAGHVPSRRIKMENTGDEKKEKVRLRESADVDKVTARINGRFYEAVKEGYEIEVEIRTVPKTEVTPPPESQSNG